MDVRNVMVVGAGQMGAGIAQVLAAAGVRVLLHDLKPDIAQRGIAGIERNLSRDVEKGRRSEDDKAAILARIQPVTDLGAAAGTPFTDGAPVEIVIEAVVENLAVKQDVWQQLDRICPPETIFASNTSSLPITQLAATTSRPDRFIGMHFFNPVPVMKLVEIIRGMATSEETYVTTRTLAERAGKTTVEVQDYPGFISNRVLMPMINEAIFCLYEGIASAEDIDTVMKLGMNHPMGPLTLADFIGLDTCLYIMEVLYEGFNDPKYRPCPLLKKMVMAGRLGRKSGAGFFEYA